MNTSSINPPSAKPPRGAGSHLKSLLLAALIALNVVLVLSLSGKLPAHTPAFAGTTAQPGGRISEYLIISSHPLGLTQDVLYILDTENSRLTVAAYDPNRGIEFTAPMDLGRR